MVSNVKSNSKWLITLTFKNFYYLKVGKQKCRLS